MGNIELVTIKIKKHIYKHCFWLDDFLVSAESVEKYERDLHAFMDTCKQLGIRLAPGKTVDPCTTTGYTVFGYYTWYSIYGGPST